jgi:hypothetical protein
VKSSGCDNSEKVCLVLRREDRICIVESFDLSISPGGLLEALPTLERVRCNVSENDHPDLESENRECNPQ